MLDVVLGVSFAVVVDMRHFSGVESCLEVLGSLHDRKSVPGADWNEAEVMLDLLALRGLPYLQMVVWL